MELWYISSHVYKIRCIRQHNYKAKHPIPHISAQDGVMYAGIN